MDKSESNRINAQKSTGPKSDAGKVASSKNAQKHGLLSRDLIIPGETKDDFDALLYQLIDELTPVGLIEHSMVEKLAISLWRQRRLVRAESAQISLSARQNTLLIKDDIRRALGNSSDLIHGGLDDLLQTPVNISADELEGHLRIWYKLSKFSLPSESVSDLPSAYRGILDAVASKSQLSPDDVIRNHGGWAKFCALQISRAEESLRALEVQQAARQAIEARSIPVNPEVIARYQSALDNEFTKTLRILRETQAWRQEQSILNAKSIKPHE